MLNARNKKLLNALTEGVDAEFLRSFFKLSTYKVNKYTQMMHPIGYDDDGNPRYSLIEACSFLIDAKAVLRNSNVELTANDLPDKLQETFWNAKLKRQKYEERAGDLWESKKVKSLMAKLMQDFRSRLQLLPDDLDRMLQLSNKQLRDVGALIDSMQNEIYLQNIDTAKENDFGNSLEADEDEKSAEKDDDDFQGKIEI